jgi:hypothetical protein
MIIRAAKLEWDQRGQEYTAWSLDGTRYFINDRAGRIGWWYLNPGDDTELRNDAESIEDAKSDAQHHWNERVIGYLDAERLEAINLAYWMAACFIKSLQEVSPAFDEVLAAIKKVEAEG